MKSKKKLIILGAFVALLALVIVFAEKKAKAAQNQSAPVPANRIPVPEVGAPPEALMVRPWKRRISAVDVLATKALPKSRRRRSTRFARP